MPNNQKNLLFLISEKKYISEMVDEWKVAAWRDSCRGCSCRDAPLARCSWQDAPVPKQGDLDFQMGGNYGKIWVATLTLGRSLGWGPHLGHPPITWGPGSCCSQKPLCPGMDSSVSGFIRLPGLCSRPARQTGAWSGAGTTGSPLLPLAPADPSWGDK